MARGDRLHRAADVVRGHEHAVGRGKVGDAAALRQPAGLGDVRRGDVGPAYLPRREINSGRNSSTLPGQENPAA